MSEKKPCLTCKHYRRGRESWELPEFWWHECTALPGMGNLRSFPFKATSCKKHEPKEKAK